jgi:branched-chain amino acid transport system ATP-binding protein
VNPPLLRVAALEAHYGAAQVLQGVDLEVSRSELAVMYGRNGVGKTTLVHAIMGLVTPSSGSITFDGEDLTGVAPHEIARRGMGLVPQGRRVFPTLTVEENLAIALRSRDDQRRWDIDAVFELLPRLGERRRLRCRNLSGGEQQMLAIARALVGNPKMLLLDEPSEGLAPLIVDELGTLLRSLREEGIPALLVEQNIRLGLALADTVYIMLGGKIAYSGSVDDFRRRPEIARRLLGV